MSDIKSMKLYTHVERIHHELAELGIGENDPIDVAALSQFDQMHYHGTDALDQAIKIVGSKPGQYWLEIGSGIGGPARYLAANANVRVTALEIQADQDELATSLTERCGLSDQVEHVCADFLLTDWEMGRYDTVASWLALYHIPERERLLEKCRALLKPGGRFYTEDLCALGDIDANQWQNLERDLSAVTLPDLDSYRQDLENAGFIIEHFTDMSSDWCEFTSQRQAQFRSARQRHDQVYGVETAAALEDFYAAVDSQFQSGKLGGVRICARSGD